MKLVSRPSGRQRDSRFFWSIETGSGYGACTVQSDRCYLFDRISDNERLRCVDSSTGEEVWSFAYPSDYEDAFGFDNGPRSSPVLDGEFVYIFGAEGKLHCVRADSGKAVWEVDTVADFGVVQNFFGVGSTPVVEQEKLLVMVGGSPPGDRSISQWNWTGLRQTVRASWHSTNERVK